MSRIKNSQDIINSMVNEVDSEENVERDFLLRNNANNVYGIQLVNKNISDRAHAEYLFKNIIPDKAKTLYEDGVIYIHDKSLQAYCISLDMKQVALEGIPTIAKNINESKPTKNFFTFMRHISNAVTLLSNQVSGAIMLANFSTIVGSYIKHHVEAGEAREITNAELYREMKHLIWELNIPLRNGAETPFTNITMEFGKCSPVIENDYIIIGGEALTEKYSDLDSKYIDMVNDAFIDVMSNPPGPGKIYTFPLCTVQYDDNFDQTNRTYRKLIENAKKTGGFYIENFQTRPFTESDFKDVNPLIKPKDATACRSMCCRLRIDEEILRSVGGGIFGSSVGNTGAVSVIDVNFNRLGLESLIEIPDDDDTDELVLKYRIEYIKLRLNNIMEIMMESHHNKREWIEKNKDLYPTFFAYNQNLKNYFSVFGVIGMHEMLVNLGFSDGIVEDDAKPIAHELMQHMHSIVNSFIEKYHVACGIEASPGENACVKLARNDKTFCRKNKIYRPYVNGVGQDVWLSSGCDVPQSFDQADRILNSAEFQCYFTSGTILHNYITDNPSVNSASIYIDRLMSNSINYITYSPIISTCATCGADIPDDKLEFCPECGSDDITVISRVIGYCKPVARKQLKKEKGSIDGDYNFWSSPRRRDFFERTKLNKKDMI